jgi:hypothetical protein
MRRNAPYCVGMHRMFDMHSIVFVCVVCSAV